MFVAFPAYAQVTGEFAAVPAQWQLTLDVIKTKAQTLLVQNKELAAQHEDLQAQLAHTQDIINQQQAANASLRQLLKERNGRTDQQIALEQLKAQVKSIKNEAAGAQEKLSIWKKKLADLERKINLQKLKIAEVQLRQDQRDVQAKLGEALQAPSAINVEAAAQLDEVRKQLEEAKAQEAMLENQIAALKDNKSALASHSGLDEENRVLGNRLESLRQQKVQREKAAMQAKSASAVYKDRYYQLKKHKALLEEQIRSYEVKASLMKKSIIDSNLPWPAQKKRMIHEMVQEDARNSQLREKITDIREDISILREGVTRMERRISAMEPKDNKSK